MHSITFPRRSVRMIGTVIFCFAIHLIVIPILLGVFLYRGLVAVLVKFLRPDLDSFVTGVDLSFLSNDPQEAVSSIVTSLIVNGNVTENRIREMYQERVLKLKDSKGKLVYMKLSQFWTSFLGFAFWKTDKSFSLSNHVRKYDHEDAKLPTPNDETSLKEVMAQLLTLPWNPNRSHWEALIVSKYKRELGPGPHDPYSLVIIRMDHSIVDAISFLGLLRVLFQSPFAIPNALRNVTQISLWDKYKFLYLFPYEAAKLLPGMLRGRYLNKQDPTKHRIYDTSESIPVSTIKKIKDKHEVDYASVLHSSITGGICESLETLKKTPPKYIDLVVTLALPDHPGGASNHMRFVSTEHPLKSVSSLDRLHVTQKILRKVGTNWSSLVSLNFVKILGIFPVTIVTKILFPCSKMGQAALYQLYLSPLAGNSLTMQKSLICMSSQVQPLQWVSL
ncbi:unnamed protein product [Allacma fusca]|uniref:O-acyltransferase WSD1 C-terminal domain-containing protein n=1 Tax=Allacma fusca TaxID=39272 RepID=A0A8J2PEJ2_9HEXA|nr:unnamed protein product [Allacma fusca]